MMSDKVILVDADGVLFDWLYSFDNWMERHGNVITNRDEYKISKRFGLLDCEGRMYCRMFNESAWIRRLPPHRDAIKWVRKLHEEYGYVFHVISSLSTDEYSQYLRTKNLIEMFGPTVFEKYIYLDTGADKDEVLAKYKGTNCIWVEDKPENADVGIELGLDSLLMSHAHNKDYDGPAEIVRNWKDIFNYIVGE
jgi:hypothetical protein